MQHVADQKVIEEKVKKRLGWQWEAQVVNQSVFSFV
jgi:hypothetical protein